MCSTSLYGVNDPALLSAFHHHFFGGVGLRVLKLWGDNHSPQLTGVVGGGVTATLHEITAITYLTPAEKLTTGKKSPSVLKFSNIPCTGCPLMRKEMLGTPRSRQQLTTSSDFRRCWLTEATALGMRPSEQRTTGRNVGLWKKRSQATSGRWEVWGHTGGLDRLLPLKCNCAFRNCVRQAMRNDFLRWWVGRLRRHESQRKLASCQKWEQTRFRPV